MVKQRQIDRSITVSSDDQQFSHSMTGFQTPSRNSQLYQRNHNDKQLRNVRKSARHADIMMTPCHALSVL